MSTTLLIILATTGISFAALSNQALMDQLVFYPYRIKRTREYHRFLSGGLIHASFGHLFVNMLTLYFFGEYIEAAFDIYFGLWGRPLFVVLYFLAVAMADAPNLFLKGNDPSYRSLGASGGTSAIVFSFILMQPMATLYVWFIPIKAVIFGILYLIYSAYMAKQENQHIGHLAHLTGALTGIVFTILLKPDLIKSFFYQIIYFLK
jgi:membrane associated rhomboid family serine protease